MSYPKMKPCPKCGETESLCVDIGEDNGPRYVACYTGFNSFDGTPYCGYRGPFCTSILWAIRYHNAEHAERKAAYDEARKKAVAS